MERIGKEDLIKTQLNILKKVASFCQERKINYSLYGGTLLGAVRHKGYIPWDDDIDISMPRPDYERFIREFHLIGDPNLKIHDPTVDKNYPYPFIKVSDERTLFVESSEINYALGVNIDIFPIDGLPISEKKLNALMKRSTFYRGLIDMKRIKIRKDREIHKNLFLIISRTLLYMIPIRFLIKQIHKLTTQYDYEYSSFIGNIVWGYGSKERCMKAFYNDYTFLEFEGDYFQTMSGYDGYLTNVFGDYMQLPPKEKQMAHHSYDAFYK